MKKLLYTSVLNFAIAVAAMSLNAQVVYSSRAVYDAAHPGNYVIDFDSYGPAGTFYPSITATTPFGAVTFDGIPSTVDVEILSSSSFGIATAGNFVLRGQGQFLTDSLLITLPANTFSFGTDVISPSATVPEPYQFTIILARALSP